MELNNDDKEKTNEMKSTSRDEVPEMNDGLMK